MSNGEPGFHDAVRTFKRDLLARALAAHKGNRTHTARALGLQRTYLLRLIREFDLKDRNIVLAQEQPCTNGQAVKTPNAPVPSTPTRELVSAERP